MLLPAQDVVLHEWTLDRSATFAYSSASTIAAMLAETIVLLTNSTPVASGTDDCAGSRTLMAKNMSWFEPVNRLDSTCTSCTVAGRAAERGSTYTWAAPLLRCAEVRAHDRPRSAAEDLDKVVVVVPMRARERVVQVGVADRDVVGRAADDVGIAHVVEAHVIDHEPAALREDARETVLAVGELGLGDRDVAVVGVELQCHAGVLLGAEEAHVAERDVARRAHVGDRRRARGHDAQRHSATMCFERLIVMPESLVDGCPTSRIGVFGVRSKSCSGATRPAGRRIVPPLTLTRLSAALNQGGFCANW